MDKLFFEEYNIDNILYTKNYKDLYTVIFINNYMNNSHCDDYKKKLKMIYKIQLDKKVRKLSQLRNK